MKNYSKEIQLEIIDEIIKNQGTTETVNVTEPVRNWNYEFLLTQGYIEQKTTPPKLFPNSEDPCGIIHIGEKLTKAGKLWRSDIHERLERELEQRQASQNTNKTQNGIWWMTLAILVLMCCPILRDILCFLAGFLK